MCVSCLIRAASNAVQYIVFKHDGDTAPQHTQVVCVFLCVCVCVLVCLCVCACFFPLISAGLSWVKKRGVQSKTKVKSEATAHELKNK
jgi:hypothetical protein